MGAGLIALIVILVVVVIILARSVRIVPQGRAGVIERLGRYTRTQQPGPTLLVPFVDRMRVVMDMREQVVSFPPQSVITAENLTVAIDSVVYFQVNDPRAATYEIANYIQAVEQLTITTLRNVVGSLSLEQALTSRDSINMQLRGVLDEATGPWGIRVARVEIKAIDPPPSIQDVMEKQMRADRDKRAMILSAEGQREASIKSAEGQKAAQILAAEGQKQAAILSAEAERQSRILRGEGERAARYLAAQGQAKAIETTFAAIHDARPDPSLLAYQYLQTLPQIAQGDANKMWIVPSEFSKAIDGLSKLAGGEGSDGEPPAWLKAGESAGEGGGKEIDTTGWFESQLAPSTVEPSDAELESLAGADDETDPTALPSMPSLADLTPTVRPAAAGSAPQESPAPPAADGPAEPPAPAEPAERPERPDRPAEPQRQAPQPDQRPEAPQQPDGGARPGQFAPGQPENDPRRSGGPRQPGQLPNQPPGPPHPGGPQQPGQGYPPPPPPPPPPGQRDWGQQYPPPPPPPPGR